jgi:hypothetical protein
MRRLPLLLPVLCAALAVPALGAAKAPAVKRLYLMSTDGGHAAYTSDLRDGHLQGPDLAQRCTVFLNPTPTRLCQNTFVPGVRWNAPLQVGPGAPLTFDVDLDVESASAPTVTFFLQVGGQQHESAPATQGADGRWRGAVTAAVTVPTSAVPLFGVRVRATGATVAMELRTGGRSWVDLGRATSLQSVPQLQAVDAVAAQTTHVTPARQFGFADRQWQAFAFDGSSAAATTFGLTLPKPAVAFYAWIEGGRRPVVHDATRGRAPRPQSLTDVPSLSVVAGGAAVGDGSGDSRAVRSLKAGPIELKVTPSAAARGEPYRVHAVAVYGPRTLRTLRMDVSYSTALRAGVVNACSHSFDPVVVPETVSTFSVDLDWSSDKPDDRWALAYDYPGLGAVVCGHAEAEDQMQFTVPPASRIWLFEPRPANGTVAASAYDTVFSYDVRFTYSR